MRKNEKKVLGDSNVQNIVRISLGNPRSKPKKPQENLLNEQKLQEILKENAALRRENDELQRKTRKSSEMQEKFDALLQENSALEHELQKFKQDFEKLLRNRATIENREKFCEIARNLKKSFAFLEENTVFFRNEALVSREKLSQKTKEFEELYLNYIKTCETLAKTSQKHENLREKLRFIENSRGSCKNCDK